MSILGLNTYAKSLPYFTLKPRQKVAQSDIAITITKTVDILAAYIWTGYDQGSQFEAGCRVWFEPSVGNYVTRNVTQELQRFDAIHRKVPRNYKEWRKVISSGTVFGASILLGGTYLHKHNTGTPFGTAYQNDFYPLQQLRDIKPVHAPAGSLIVVDRDIFNIDPTKTFNAWDVELVMIVNELSALTRLYQGFLRAAARRIGLKD